MTLQDEEKKVTFCAELFQEAFQEAKKRTGTEPKNEHVQMSDLIKAFRALKLNTYLTQFGHIDTEWNEALAIIAEFTSINKRKELPRLPQEIGNAIGRALVSWSYFDKLPSETKEEIKKQHLNFLNTKEKSLQHAEHLFSEIKMRSSSLSPSEKELVSSLLMVYEQQCNEAKNKGSVSTMKASIEKLIHELNKMIQGKGASRELQSFVTKARHDAEHFTTMNF